MKKATITRAERRRRAAEERQRRFAAQVAAIEASRNREKWHTQYGGQIDLERLDRLEGFKDVVGTWYHDAGPQVLLFGPRGEVLKEKPHPSISVTVQADRSFGWVGNASAARAFVEDATGADSDAVVQRPEADGGRPSVRKEGASLAADLTITGTARANLAPGPAAVTGGHVPSTVVLYAPAVARMARIDQARRRARWVMGWVEVVIPRRIAQEELGDALEYLQRPGLPLSRIYAKTAATIFWVVVNAARELASVVWGRKAA